MAPHLNPATIDKDDQAKEEEVVEQEAVLCAFCQASPAAVMVQLPSTRIATKKKKKAIPTPFCLLHYYTTSACRVGEMMIPTTGGDSEVRSIINDTAVQMQLPKQQEIFAEAFVQLQQELQEIVLHQVMKDDPLAVLADLHQSSTTSSRRNRNMKAPPTRPLPPKPPLPKRQRQLPEGGFLKDIPVPERLVRTQQQQHENQQRLIARMNAGAKKAEDDPTKRRKQSRHSVWNIISGDDRKTQSSRADRTKTLVQLSTESNDVTIAVTGNTTNSMSNNNNDQTCTCGSDNVEMIYSNVSHRNQDMPKAETWGSKDRADEIIVRYQCQSCGKAWNVEE